ncbi:unnamed protein product [Thelazia callipaeda]|uniref:Uncharacterized protein n=1 Tax=Thelazia callipaeda TaxID=103827 RepID=A0A0N5CSI7_THECL|nr:unnamed protein product [Thelazia callipaeda]
MQKMSTTPGIPRPSPIQVLTRPNVALLDRSDEMSCFQRGMVVDMSLTVISYYDLSYHRRDTHLLARWEPLRQAQNPLQYLAIRISCGIYPVHLRISFINTITVEDPRTVVPSYTQIKLGTSQD